MGSTELTGPNPRTADEGHLTLEWTPASSDAETATEYRVEQADSADFKNPVERYRGPDLAFFTSGLPEGRHYFRVRSTDSSTWSQPLKVTVTYPKAHRVKSLLVLGGVTFAILIYVVVSGHQTYYGEDPGKEGPSP